MNARWLTLPAMIGLLAGCSGSDRLRRPDALTIIAPLHYWDDHAASDGRGRVWVVVEIPTGTTAKWEVDKLDGALHWKLENGEPRVVRYLGYPGNYGMVPRTILPEELGGDGDALDVLVLGPPVERGRLIQARVICVLELRDDGERDDKLIAVRDGGAFGDLRDLSDLRERFPGVTSIVETWFTNYKGPGHIEALGWLGADEAREVLEAAQREYDRLVR